MYALHNTQITSLWGWGWVQSAPEKKVRTQIRREFRQRHIESFSSFFQGCSPLSSSAPFYFRQHFFAGGLFSQEATSSSSENDEERRKKKGIEAKREREREREREEEGNLSHHCCRLEEGTISSPVPFFSLSTTFPSLVCDLFLPSLHPSFLFTNSFFLCVRWNFVITRLR